MTSCRCARRAARRSLWVAVSILAFWPPGPVRARDTTIRRPLKPFSTRWQKSKPFVPATACRCLRQRCSSWWHILQSRPSVRARVRLNSSSRTWRGFRIPFRRHSGPTARQRDSCAKKHLCRSDGLQAMPLPRLPWSLKSVPLAARADARRDATGSAALTAARKRGGPKISVRVRHKLTSNTNTPSAPPSSSATMRLPRS